MHDFVRVALLVSLVLGRMAKGEVGEVYWLLAGVAVSGPAVEDGLEEADRLGEREARRWALGQGAPA